MSEKNGRGPGEQEVAVRSLLDRLLESRSDEFKAKVYELVVRYGWDVNDPSFVILIATNQLEVLLVLFPKKFEELFLKLLKLQQQRFGEMQDHLDGQRADIRTYLQGVEATGSQLVSGVSEQVRQLEQFTDSQHTQVEEDVRNVLSLAKEEREKLHQDLEKKLKVASKAHLAAVESEASTLIETAGTKLKGKYLKELVTPVAIAALTLFSLGGITGWTFHRQAMGALDPAGPRQLSSEQWESLQWAVSKEGQLARNLIEWNEPNLSECLAGQGMGGETLELVNSEKQLIKYGNCSLWVVSPGKRKFGPKPSQ